MPFAFVRDDGNTKRRRSVVFFFFEWNLGSMVFVWRFWMDWIIFWGSPAPCRSTVMTAIGPGWCHAPRPRERPDIAYLRDKFTCAKPSERNATPPTEKLLLPLKARALICLRWPRPRKAGNRGLVSNTFSRKLCCISNEQWSQEGGSQMLPTPQTHKYNFESVF